MAWKLPEAGFWSVEGDTPEGVAGRPLWEEGWSVNCIPSGSLSLGRGKLKIVSLVTAILLMVLVTSFQVVFVVSGTGALYIPLAVLELDM